LSDERKQLRELESELDAEHKQALAEVKAEIFQLLNPTDTRNLPRLMRISDFTADENKLIEDSFEKFAKIIHRGDVRPGFVPVLKSQIGSSSYDPVDKTLHWSPDQNTAGLFHELGHWLELESPVIKQQAIAFLERRTAGNKPRKVIDEYPSVKNPHAEHLPDDFYSSYVGRLYGKRDATGKFHYSATEIISCGIEFMLEDPHNFAKADPEHFELIYNVLRGGS
jgi:hypothetical protein